MVKEEGEDYRSGGGIGYVRVKKKNGSGAWQNWHSAGGWEAGLRGG